jgi:hypothetical protein
MTYWSRAEREAKRALQTFDADDLHDQLNSIRDHLMGLSRSFSKATHQRLGHARDFAMDTAHDAEETMKDHLAASMLLALGLGVAIGYLIRRGTE